MIKMDAFVGRVLALFLGGKCAIFKVKIDDNIDFALKIRKSNLFFAKSGVPDSIVFSAQN